MWLESSGSVPGMPDVSGPVGCEWGARGEGKTRGRVEGGGEGKTRHS